MNRSIIDLAREHPNARISRQQGGHWQVAGRSRGGSHVANMCNAVVLGAVRWHSPRVVTGDAPAPASCMESLSGCAQILAQLSEPSGDP